ncbi:MAG: BamA/TamA family outer membrane protein [Thermoanaerobaculia bacterium]
MRALLLATLLIAPAVMAKTAVEPPRFPIESIAVEGTRYVSPEILISESRLTEGGTYTEAELLEAVYRIRRLPFVLEAEMALERGSERGQLRLVITVEEVRRYFFGGELLFSHFGTEIALNQTFTSDSSFRFAPIAGVRFSAGDYGLFFVAANGGSLQAGYTRYRLFGRQAFLNFGVVRSSCCPVDVLPLGLDPTFSSWSSEAGSTTASLALGIPLRAKNQSLRLLATYRETEEGRRRLVFDPGPPADVFTHRDSADHSLELAWVSDTRDDPVLPTRGRSLTAAVELRQLDSPLDVRRTFDETSGLFVDQGVPEGSMSSRLVRATFSAERHWPLTPRQALSVKIRVATGRSRVEDLAVESQVVPEQDLDVFEGTVSLRHAIAVWRPRAGGPAQELWWENTLDFGYEETSFDLGMAGPLRRWGLTTSLTFRNSWGIFRLGLAFVDVGRIT